MSEVKKTMVERIIEFVKGGEKANVANILKVAGKKWAKQIVLKKRKIKDLKEKLDETLEEQDDYKADELIAYKEAFLDVDVEVKGRDSVVSYINHTYEQQIANAKYSLDARDEKITALKANADAAIKQLEKDIKFYEDLLKEIA